MLATGKVERETEGGFYIFVPCVNHKEEVRRASPTVYVEFVDARRISPEQRRKVYALLGHICEWSGYVPLEAEKALLKEYFAAREYSITEADFSLSNCSMSRASDFIGFLLEFCVTNGVNTGSDALFELAEDIPRYVWACALNKKCCVCGKKAEIHHARGGIIGMGANRYEVNHIGRPCLPLCRLHHREIHDIGEDDFCQRYLVEPIRIDRQLVDLYRLNRKKRARKGKQ